jgi:hypothetical protein
VNRSGGIRGICCRLTLFLRRTFSHWETDGPIRDIIFEHLPEPTHGTLVLTAQVEQFNQEPFSFTTINSAC